MSVSVRWPAYKVLFPRVSSEVLRKIALSAKALADKAFQAATGVDRMRLRASSAAASRSERRMKPPP
ncbi:hypothetical protein BSY16_3972 [Sinorhizobium sp. RAC02]|nr:hypothetical protein BSY16_3972 [Sinorhizobium sp. RAC02]